MLKYTLLILTHAALLLPFFSSFLTSLPPGVGKDDWAAEWSLVAIWVQTTMMQSLELKAVGKLFDQIGQGVNSIDYTLTR